VIEGEGKSSKAREFYEDRVAISMIADEIKEFKINCCEYWIGEYENCYF
jgi:hypothetical protein